MKRLLQIVAVAFVLFMVLAVAQQWRVFGSAWFGDGPAPESLTETEKQAAADTVARMLALMRHFYLSGGDARFAERMPASPGLIDEMAADVDYLARNHRLQDPELLRLLVLSVEPAAAGSTDRVEVRTREHWSFRVVWGSDGTPAEPPRERTVEGRYFLVRTGTSWAVEGWRPIVDRAAGEGAP